MQLPYLKTTLPGTQRSIAVSPSHVLFSVYESKDSNHLLLKNRELQTIATKKVFEPMADVKFMPKQPEIAVTLSNCISCQPIRIYHIEKGEILLNTALQSLSGISAFVPSSEYPELLLGTSDGELELFDIARNHISHHICSEVEQITALCSWGDSTYFVGSGRSLERYDRRTNSISKPLHTGAAEIIQLQACIRGGVPAIYLLEKQDISVKVVDFSGKFLTEIANDKPKPILRFSTNGFLIAIADEAHIVVYDTITQTVILRTERPCDAIECDNTRLWIVSGKTCEAIPFISNATPENWAESGE